MKFYLLAILLLLGLAFTFLKPKQETPLSLTLWDSYKLEFNKHYSEAEDIYRQEIFYENQNKIELLNNNQHDTAEYGITQFSDMTQEEFELQMLTLLPTGRFTAPEINTPSNDKVDWREEGAVSNVKNQGACGSCYAFSAVGNLEAVNFIFKGDRLVTYSEQQLVDCSGSYGNYGCNGGLMTYCFKYVRDKGITTDSEYKYVAKQQSCKKDGGDFAIKDYREISAGDCDEQKDEIKKQPVSVAVDASRWSSYRSGIFSNCGKSLNHGVTAVGYVDNDYWIIKNSWGKNWGESGYMKLKMGDTCGVCQMSSTAYL